MLMKIGKEWSQENGCFTADHLSASQINLDLSIGGNIFKDDGFRQGEITDRKRFNLR